jgi:hypothetical protein
MNLERQIIIDWLVARPDNEAHPELTTLVMRAMKAEKYNDAVHKRVLAAGDEFDMAVRAACGSITTS